LSCWKAKAENDRPPDFKTGMRAPEWSRAVYAGHMKIFCDLLQRMHRLARLSHLWLHDRIRRCQRRLANRCLDRTQGAEKLPPNPGSAAALNGSPPAAG
jgi:hypothetical protein